MGTIGKLLRFPLVKIAKEVGGVRNSSRNVYPITCRAAVAWEANKPLSIETVEVAPPNKGEVRIKIEACGVCHSDAHGLAGNTDTPFPMVLGHEAAGIVESVGEGVTSVKPGDHVIPLFVPQCNECHNCKSTHTNLCFETLQYPFKGVLRDQTTRFTCKGQSLNQFMATSTFSEYTVVMETCVAKISPVAPSDKVCLIGCCVSTGYGAAVVTANVRPGSTCAVWGLGGVGLSAVQGCKAAGASKIIGVDINPDKFKYGKIFGCTDFVNPLDIGDKKIEHVLGGITGLPGVDFAFDCIGGVQVAQTVFNSIVPGGGVAVIIGVTHKDQTIKIAPIQFLVQKTITGSIFGGFKGKDKVPQLVDDYINKKIKLDELITHSFSLDKINEAFQLMKDGKSIRSVIKF